MTTTNATTNAKDILSNLSKIKFQKVVESWMLPVTYKNYQERVISHAMGEFLKSDGNEEDFKYLFDEIEINAGMYWRNPNFHWRMNSESCYLPSSQQQAALFLHTLLVYWQKKEGLTAHTVLGACNQSDLKKIQENGLVIICYRCCYGNYCDRLLRKLFGDKWFNLPFIRNIGDLYDSAYEFSLKDLLDFALS